MFHETNSTMPKNSQKQSVQRPPCLDTLKLFQKPRKWTTRHLEIAKVQKKTVSADGLIDPQFLPLCDDLGELFPLYTESCANANTVRIQTSG